MEEREIPEWGRDGVVELQHTKPAQLGHMVDHTYTYYTTATPCCLHVPCGSNQGPSGAQRHQQQKPYSAVCQAATFNLLVALLGCIQQPEHVLSVRLLLQA